MSEASLADRPAHVPAGNVVDFDLYRPPAVKEGYHDAWAALSAEDVPDIVWTPRQGGHWIVTRGELVAEVLSDHARFSNRVIMVPKADGEHHKMIPTTMDPPEHRPWRMLLNDNLSPRAVRRVEGDIRAIAVDLIEAVRADGRCDFIAAYAGILPIRIFLKLVDLPLDDAPRLKWLSDQVTRPDGSIAFQDVVARFHAYLDDVVEERLGTTRDDMFSRMINTPVEGRAMTRHEALQLCSQVLIAGLDTVVNFLGFAMLHLATHHELRDRLAADPALIPAAVNELLRRYPIVTIGREVKRDMAYAGVELKAGDMVMAPTALHGLDPRANDRPGEVDLKRRDPAQSTFGSGDHRCPGAHLARTELVISLEEWLARVPGVTLAPGAEPTFSGGIVGCVDALPLVWGRAMSGGAAIVERFVAAWNALDWDAIFGAMHPDIVYHNMPWEPVHGMAAVRENLLGFGITEAAWTIHAIVADGPLVMTERTDRFRAGDHAMAIRVMGVFEIEDGLIRAWRDYFDPAEMGAAA